MLREPQHERVVDLGTLILSVRPEPGRRAPIEFSHSLSFEMTKHLHVISAQRKKSFLSLVDLYPRRKSPK